MSIASKIICLLILICSCIEPALAVKPILPATKKTEKLKKNDTLPKNKLAKWSLILAGSGFLLVFIPYLNMLAPYLMVAGLVCGIIALSQIKKSKERGKGLAIASLILGGVFLLTAIIAIAVLFSLFK